MRGKNEGLGFRLWLCGHASMMLVSVAWHWQSAAKLSCCNELRNIQPKLAL